MSIENRGENKWRFRIRKDGINYSQNFYGTEKEAIKQHKLFEADVLRGNLGYNENMKFSELAELCIHEYYEKQCKAATLRCNKGYYYNHLVPHFGTMKISAIKTIHIQQFVSELNKTLKPNTINGIVNVLDRSYNLAIEWGILKENPCTNVKKPASERRGGKELMCMEEIIKLFELYDKEENLMHKSAFYLAIGCGLRNSEIRALTTDDIDFDKNTISVNKQIAEIYKNGVLVEDVSTTKTVSSNRVIYAPEFVMQCLNEYIKSMPYIPITKQIFWSHVTRKPITKCCLSKRFKSILLNNNLTEIKFHDLRHLQATLLISANVNIQAVAKRLGHSTIRTTMETYVHNIQEVDKVTSDVFENYIQKQIEAK